MTTIAAIVQARMRSTRLPGKVMLDLAGHTVLSHVLRRCAAIPGVDVVCCATTDGADTDLLAIETERCGVRLFRGSETDVLDRYYQAARMLGADVVLRVTSDCPLVDPDVCGQVLRLLVEKKFDYTCNNMPHAWPHGLDCEAFTISALERAASMAVESFDREHVTPWLRRNLEIQRGSLPGPSGEMLNQRWTLDFPEDFSFFETLFAYLPPWPVMPNVYDVMSVLKVHPEIMSLNSTRHGVSRPS